ncbi:ARM repeat-containing protein [Multifurca ochricompacta]|uniref:ARM repeat-containing protein n=1 Tax=Multifurca ochricompacta TaxID=376703 RepID=A0AAD4MBQ5_9AGAM|nr:ARM repeat-containing protein [Multifurca ochricompacta]
MTVQAVNVSTLKRVKNNVIGNPSAKLVLAEDELFVATLVKCLNAPEQFEEAAGSQDDIRVEAAQVITSLSYGSPEALRSLLHANAHQSFLYAISRFGPTEPAATKAAFARALRAIAAASAELVGPSQWGIKDDSSPVREDAKLALEYFFQLLPAQIEVLDLYLPLLTDSSTQASMSIAQLLGAALRAPSHRTTVAEWVPSAERSRETSRGRRRWERPEAIAPAQSGNGGGWVARHLTTLLRSRDVKVQEAALNALAALAKDNHDVAIHLARAPVGRPNADYPLALTLALKLCKSRSTDVQLAAGLCATHIIRASAANHHHPAPPDLAASLVVMHVMNRLIDSKSESPQCRTKACFILNYLVMDEKELCQSVYDKGSLAKLSELVHTLTPPPATDSKISELEDEPESLCCLREAALTTIAVLALADNDIRRDVTDVQRLLPPLASALTHRHIGVRYAACQCVRALSRSVAVTRTSLVDSGLGTALFAVFTKDDEDRRVLHAALAAVCNLVNQYSPLRTPFLEQGIATRLARLLRSPYAELRVSALWALKNLVYKCAPETKRAIMGDVGWPALDARLDDADAGVREQALYLLRNFADCEDDVDAVFDALGTPRLLGAIAAALEARDTDVVLQAAYTLANLANGHAQRQALILAHGQLLRSLRSALVDAPADARCAALGAVIELAWGAAQLRAAGIESTVRHLVEFGGGGGPGVGGGGGGGGNGGGVGVSGGNVDREVRERARRALEAMERVTVDDA